MTVLSIGGIHVTGDSFATLPKGLQKSILLHSENIADFHIKYLPSELIYCRFDSAINLSDSSAKDFPQSLCFLFLIRSSLSQVQIWGKSRRFGSEEHNVCNIQKESWVASVFTSVLCFHEILSIVGPILATTKLLSLKMQIARAELSIESSFKIVTFFNSQHLFQDYNVAFMC